MCIVYGKARAHVHRPLFWRLCAWPNCTSMGTAMPHMPVPHVRRSCACNMCRRLSLGWTFIFVRVLLFVRGVGDRCARARVLKLDRAFVTSPEWIGPACACYVRDCTILAELRIDGEQRGQDEHACDCRKEGRKRRAENSPMRTGLARCRCPARGGVALHARSLGSPWDSVRIRCAFVKSPAREGRPTACAEFNSSSPSSPVPPTKQSAGLLRPDLT